MIRFFFFELFNYEVNIIMYIDIRSHDKYLNGHIENAKNIGMYELLLHPGMYLSKSRTYYIYCDTGFRSKMVVDKLYSIGYNCVNIEGGYNNYLIKS